jgi:hypothetical protein
VSICGCSFNFKRHGSLGLKKINDQETIEFSRKDAKTQRIQFKLSLEEALILSFASLRLCVSHIFPTPESESAPFNL